MQILLCGHSQPEVGHGELARRVLQDTLGQAETEEGVVARRQTGVDIVRGKKILARTANSVDQGRQSAQHRGSDWVI